MHWNHRIFKAVRALAGGMLAPKPLGLAGGTIKAYIYIYNIDRDEVYISHIDRSRGQYPIYCTYIDPILAFLLFGSLNAHAQEAPVLHSLLAPVHLGPGTFCSC